MLGGLIELGVFDSVVGMYIVTLALCDSILGGLQLGYKLDVWIFLRFDQHLWFIVNWRNWLRHMALGLAWKARNLSDTLSIRSNRSWWQRLQGRLLAWGRCHRRLGSHWHWFSDLIWSILNLLAFLWMDFIWRVLGRCMRATVGLHSRALLVLYWSLSISSLSRWPLLQGWRCRLATYWLHGGCWFLDHVMVRVRGGINFGCS